MRYLFLSIIFVSFLFSSNLRRDANLKVVIDNKNNLMWVDDVTNLKLRLSHEKATEYCKELSHAGYSNWRLPDIEEYALIVDKKNEINYINKAFRFNLPDGYWASKAHWRTFWFYADYMYFVSGTPYYDSRHKNKLFRCVRSMK
ncbi:MAG: DUF1566 domain-containing protein [Halarcobacter sp.]